MCALIVQLNTAGTTFYGTFRVIVPKLIEIFSKFKKCCVAEYCVFLFCNNYKTRICIKFNTTNQILLFQNQNFYFLFFENFIFELTTTFWVSIKSPYFPLLNGESLNVISQIGRKLLAF